MNVFAFILINNILPIFAIVTLGFYVSKKFDLNVQTLSKLIFYIISPCFVFVYIYNAEIHMEMMKVVIAVVLLLVLNMILASFVSKIKNYDTGMKNAFVNSIMFYNSANMGIPLITLVFSSEPFIVNGQTPYLNAAVTAQLMVLMVQNLSVNTIGFINAGRAHGHLKDSFVRAMKMPIIYFIIVAFIMKLFPYDLTRFPLWHSVNYIANALVAVNLIALGVQLSKTRFALDNGDVYLSCFLRLLVGPVMALPLIYLLKVEGIMAQVIMIASSLPTGVNTALIAVEYDNYPEFASQVVMTSTLLSSLTLTVVIYFARLLFPVI